MYQTNIFLLNDFKIFTELQFLRGNAFQIRSFLMELRAKHDIKQKLVSRLSATSVLLKA